MSTIQKNKKLVLILLVFAALLAVIFYFVQFLSLFSTSNIDNKSINKLSTDFSDKTDKINFLKEYLVCPSDVIDTEYHIVIYDNSTGFVPGPSDWYYTIAVKVALEDVKLWTTDMEIITADKIDKTWWSDLSLDEKNWNPISEPVCYKRPNENSYLVVYSAEGIIYKYIFTT